MNAKSSLPFLALILVVTLGCAGKARRYETVMVPPKVDLKQHELIGMIEFASTADGDLAAFTSKRFADMARRDQGLVRMVDLGTVEHAKQAVGRQSWDPETFKAIGRELNVRTLLIGELKISDVKPSFTLGSALRSGSVSAEVDAVLEVQLIETETGASLWSRTAQARRSIGSVSVGQGRPLVFDADDPERAYGELVNSLVGEVTRDFHVAWERRYF